MDPMYWAIIAGAVVAAFVLGGTIVWLLMRRRHAHGLRKRFGPEYDRVVDRTGNKRLAEDELLRREERVKRFDIHPLTIEQRAHYADSWRRVQASFVDQPVRAVAEADELVTEVMQKRGYPMGDFEQRAEDLSVDHPQVVTNYREGHALALRSDRGEADTENLRQAMVHYRELFEDLLEEPTTDGRDRTYHEVRRER